MKDDAEKKDIMQQTEKIFWATQGRFIRAYGKERANKMMAAVTLVMGTIAEGRTVMECRDMQVDIFNAVAKLYMLGQRFKPK